MEARELDVIQPVRFKLIKLKTNVFTKVDNKHFEYLSRFKWHLSNDGYAYSNKLGKMHRFLMGYPKEGEVDHKNRNKIDNRKINLRIASRSQNNANKLPKKFTSIFKGVSWHKGTMRWRATITKNRKQTHLGFYDNEKDAAKAYNLKAIEIYGEFAFLNIIK